MKQKVILVCSECLSRNYTITKNKRVNVERLELKNIVKMRKTYFAQRNEVGGIDVKFRDWFSLKAIRSEIKRISWLSKNN